MSEVLPQHVAHNNVGYIAMLKGEYRLAREHLKSAMRLSPRYYEKADENLQRLESLQLAPQ
jgi:Flp pilus assembly protein TadD